MRSDSWRRRSIVACAAVLVSFNFTAVASGDILELEGGGEIAGVLVERRESGEHVVRTPDGATIAVDRSQIDRYVEEDPNLLAYRERAKATPDTAKAHRKLARWCEERRLIERRDHHYRRVLQLDPEDEEARTKLGYRRVGSQWMTRDELMQARGMQMYDGEYRSAQAIALLKQSETRERSDAEWFNKLRTWRNWMDSSRSDRAAEGQSRIAAINDPAAAPALAKLLQREDAPWIQQELLAALGQLPHPVTAETLVELALYSEDDAIAHDALDYLIRLDVPRSIVPFIRALRHKDNVIVNRAAEALGEIGDEEAISPLIDALETTHRYKVGSGGRTNATLDSSGAFTFGGGPKVVERTHQNIQALQALVKLSDQEDFGYDERLWRKWYVNERSRNQIDARRDL